MKHAVKHIHFVEYSERRRNEGLLMKHAVYTSISSSIRNAAEMKVFS
jgi:hypothetical protein